MQKLISIVIERFRAAQERIKDLADSSVSKTELAALQADHQQETQSLIERLDSQKLAMEAQFDRIVWRLQETNNSLETLSAGAARADDLEQFGRQQAQDREKVLTVLGAQRRDLEALAEQTNARCQAITERLDALPADLATTAHIEQARQEHAGQIRDLLNTLESSRTRLEQSIQSVSDYCDRTSTSVSNLAAEAARADEVQELRDTHDEKIGQIEQRIDEQEKLQVNRLHLLTRKVKEQTQRVSRLEEQNRTPVRLERAPRAGAELGRVVEAAQQQHTCLTEAVERAGAIAAHLHNASAQVQEALHHWANNADRVQEQSQNLQQAAETAERILTAMRQCHAVMDRKLNSQRWQAELGRGEAVARKMEKTTTEAVAAAKQLNAVLRDFDRYQELAGDWASRTQSTRQTIENMTGQAQQTVRQLSRLITEASTVGSKFEQSLNRRKQMLSAVAQNTSRLMELIDAARQADESVSRPGRKADGRSTDPRTADSRLTDMHKTDGRKTRTDSA